MWGPGENGRECGIGGVSSVVMRDQSVCAMVMRLVDCCGEQHMYRSVSTIRSALMLLRRTAPNRRVGPTLLMWRQADITEEKATTGHDSRSKCYVALKAVWSTLTTHDTLVSSVCGWVRARLAQSGRAAPVDCGAHWRCVAHSRATRVARRCRVAPMGARHAATQCSTGLPRTGECRYTRHRWPRLAGPRLR